MAAAGEAEAKTLGADGASCTIGRPRALKGETTDVDLVLKTQGRRPNGLPIARTGQGYQWPRQAGMYLTILTVFLAAVASSPLAASQPRSIGSTKERITSTSSQSTKAHTNHMASPMPRSTLVVSTSSVLGE